MKKKVIKFTKLLLLMTMIISDLMAPIKVLADEMTEVIPSKGEVGINGVVSNSDSVTVSLGAIRNADGTLSNEGDVSVTKTVSPSIDNYGNVIDGRYRVEFNIKGKDVVNSTEIEKPVYAVVVFDNSGSMQNYCIGNILGFEYKKEIGTVEDCSLFADSIYTLYPTWKNSVNGAKVFANELLEKIPSANIGLVTFSTNATIVRGFDDPDVNSNANLNNVSFGTPNGGTNLHAGLIQAKNMLSSQNIPENANKYIVIISDGNPTYYISADGSVGGNGGSTSDDILTATYGEATSIKSDIEVFTIGYDLTDDIVTPFGSIYGNLSTKDILRTISSTDTQDDINNNITHYLDSNPNAVASAFTNIATSISRISAGTDVTLTDNIGTNFKIVGQEGNTYTTTISEITETGTTISFEIEIDNSKIITNGWYNTNEGFSLTYTDTNGVVQTLSTNQNPQVYWTPSVYEYTVNYYKDSLDSTPIASDVFSATNGTVVNTVQQNKYLNDNSLGTIGYEFNSVSTLPVTITNNEVVVDVLYTIKKFNYNINYYYDNELDSTISSTVSNVSYGTVVDADALHEFGTREGYSLDENKTTCGNVTIDEDSININIYYKKNSYGFTVNYHFNNEEGFSIGNSALFGTEINASDNYLSDTELQEKNEEDNKEYFISPVRPSAPNKITIGTNETENVINIYYVSTVVTSEDIRKTSDTTKITSGDTPVTYTVNYTSIVNNVNKGDTVRVVVTDTLPYEIDVEKSNLDVTIEGNVVNGVYDNTNKTITWTFEKAMTEFTERYDASKTIVYTVVYKNVGIGDGSDLVNRVVGNTTAGGKTTTGIGASDSVEVEIPANVIVHHYLEGTTTSVSKDVPLNGFVGESYETNSVTVFGYTVNESKLPSNASGIYTEDTIEVIYYYVKNDGSIEDTTIVKTSNDSDKIIDSVNDTFGYTITATGEVRDYVGKVIVTVVDELPYALTEEAIDGLDNVCVYDSENKTITCTREETISENNYVNGVYNVNEVFELELAFEGVTDKEVVNNARVNIKLDSDVTDEDDGKEVVTIKEGNVVVRHYLEGTTTSIDDDETLTGLVGESYETNSVIVFGYTVNGSKLPSNASGIYTEDTIEVIYYYVKNDGSVEDATVVKTSNDSDKIIDSVNDTFGYTITATGEVRDYVGKVTVTVVDELPYALTEEAINGLDNVCVYDSENKTITCTREEIISENNYVNGVYNVNEVFELELAFEGVTDKEVVNNARVNIKLDSDVTDEDDGKEVVTIKEGSVVVTYKVAGTDTSLVEEEITLNGLAGEEYTTEVKSFYGYSLSKLPSNRDGQYLADRTIYVEYEYIKNDGSVSGNTLVKDGPDSIDRIDDTFNYVFKYNASVTGYTGKVTLKITDTLPFGAVIVSKDNNCIYDEDSLTIVCQKEYNVNSDTTISENFNVSLKYKDINFSDITNSTVLTNNLVAELIYGDNTITDVTSKDTTVKKGTVIVTYRDTDDNILYSDITLNGLAGEEYRTEEKSFFGYTLVSEPVNVNGEYAADRSIIVNYVYDKNNGSIEDTTIVKTSNDSDKIIDSVNDIFGYTITATGEVRDYVGKVIVTVVDELPYALTEEAIDGLDNVCVYDGENKTITCTREETISENNYVNGVYNVNEVFELELAFENVTDKEVVNNARVNIKLDSDVKDENNDTEEVTVESGKVIVTYEDTFGNKLDDDIILEGLVGNSYTTIEKEFFGYTLTSTPVNANGVYTEEDIIVEYVYSKNIGSSEEEFVKTGDSEVKDINTPVNYTITYNTVISDYVGESTLVITDELPYEIDIEKSVYNTENCEYSEGKLICTYTKNITKEDNSFDIEELFTLYYIDITNSEVTNKATAVLTYETTTKTNDSECTSKIKTSNVVVNYVTKDGSKLTDTIVLTGMVGKSYNTDKKKFDKYSFIEVRGEVEGEFTEEDTEVTYVYDLTPLPPQTGIECNMFMFIKYLLALAIIVISGKTYKIIKNN